MLVTRTWTFTQTEPATVWNIANVPEGALYPSITEVFAEGGEIIQPDSQLVSPDGLQLSFGVQAKSGTAVGKYYVEQQAVPDPEIIQDGAGNNVTITVTQNTGGTPTGTTF